MRQLVALGDQATDQRTGRRADFGGGVDGAERFGAFGALEQHGCEDVDGWDEQRRANALKDRVAEHQHQEVGRQGRDEGARAIDEQAQHQADAPAPDRREACCSGDHQRGHREREQRDRGLDAGNVGAQVRGDGLDRDTGAGRREATQELREDEGDEHARRRGGGRGQSGIGCGSRHQGDVVTSTT